MDFQWNSLQWCYISDIASQVTGNSIPCSTASPDNNETLELCDAREHTGDQRFLLTKGQLCGNDIHAITPSCVAHAVTPETQPRKSMYKAAISSENCACLKTLDHGSLFLSRFSSSIEDQTGTNMPVFCSHRNTSIFFYNSTKDLPEYGNCEVNFDK